MTSPATKGLTASTGAAAELISSLIPGTARIGPIEMTGFDGPTTIASAPSIAAWISGVIDASPMPASSIPSIGGPARSWTRYSWNPRQPDGIRTRVRTGSSHIGRTVARTPSARARSGADHGQPLSGVEPSAALQAGRQVAVGEAEPVRAPRAA